MEEEKDTLPNLENGSSVSSPTYGLNNPEMQMGVPSAILG